MLFSLFQSILSFWIPQKGEADEEQNALYQDLESGDIVYAHMPLGKWKQMEIPESHQVRPYYVLQKKNGFVYAVPGTSVPKVGYFIYRRRKSVYPWHYRYAREVRAQKDTYFDMSRKVRLPISHLEYYWGTTNRQEREYNKIKYKL